jgi:hypothetical protein
LPYAWLLKHTTGTETKDERNALKLDVMLRSSCLLFNTCDKTKHAECIINAINEESAFVVQAFH